VGVAGTGGRGTLIGSALEQSNVDIAQEFTQMILAQRGYQANSKTITVSDELLVDTLNLKR
jgi:flagellar hook protein FlgE